MMKLNKAAIVLITGIATFQCLGSQAMSAPVTQKEATQLRQGRVVVNDASPGKASSSLPSVTARILIAKPPQEVWKKVLQPQHLMDNETKVKDIKVVSQQGTTQDLHYTVVMSKMLPTLNYTLRHQVTQPNTLQFHRLNGSFKDIQGSWNVQPFDNGKSSVLTYNLSIDPGPLMPRFMMDSLLKSDLPRMMTSVKSVIAQK